MRVISPITEPQVIRKMLDPLGVRASPLPHAPARDPDWKQVDLGYEGFEGATRQGWSGRSKHAERFMKSCSSSSGCEPRPVKA